MNDWYKHNRQRLRREAIAALGDKCVRCGFNDYRALQIDHVGGDGSEERAARYSYFKSIIADPIGAATRYQILCANCHQIKTAENHDGPTSEQISVGLQAHHQMKKMGML